MTNDTPSVQHTNAPQPIDISEAGTVERAIQIEDRMEEIIKTLNYYDHLIFEASVFGEYPHWIEEKYDELESELSDLQREYRG